MNSRAFRILFYCLASLALHSLIFKSIFYFSPKSPKLSYAQLVELQIENSPSTLKNLRSVTQKSNFQVHSLRYTQSPQSKNSSSKLSSSSLGEKLLIESSKPDFQNAGTAAPNGQTIFGEGPAPAASNGAWVEQVDFKHGIELTSFFQHLIQKIDRSLDYPEDMAKQRIQGDVRVDFYVNSKGQLEGDFHSVKGSEPLLKLYVLSSLIVILKDPLPKNLWSLNEEKIALSVHVHFETYEMIVSKTKEPAKFQSNELTLNRFKYVTPWVVEKIDKIFTRYVPPIIPIPGGFYVDVIRLAQFINNINTPDPDDQRKERLDLKREVLELAIRKKTEEKSSPSPTL